MQLRTLPLILLCLSLTCVGRAAGARAANNPPTAEEVKQFIVTSLPGYWKVDHLNLSDPVDYGNPIEPEWRWRYEAVITPKEPLYVANGHHEKIVLLELSHSAESPQTLYGIAIAKFQAGNWNGEAQHENRPFDHNGEPASFFGNRTVVGGSPEERRLREATQQNALEKLEAKHKTESKALKIEHQAALAAAKETHLTILANLKIEHDTKQERRKAELQNELAKAPARRAEHVAALENLKVKHDGERKHRKVEHQNELARASAQHAEQMAALEADSKAKAKERHAQIAKSEKLTELAIKANQKLTALHAAETAMLITSERVHEDRKSGLKKIFDALDVVTNSDDYLALLDTAKEGQLEWMQIAILRYGLESKNSALGTAARRHLLQINIEDNPDLLYLVANHIQDFIGRPEMIPIVEKTIALLIRDRKSIQTITDTLASVNQWANEVIDFSSEMGSGDRSAKQTLGEPDTSGCSDYWKAWMPGTENPGLESIRVRFAQSVWFPEIGVHENYNVGSIRKIILWDTKGNGTEYDVQDPVSECPGIAKFKFDKYSRSVNELTVVFDTKTVQGRIQIDAISLSGKVLETK